MVLLDMHFCAAQHSFGGMEALLYRDFYFCAPGSLALLIHPNLLTFAHFSPLPCPKPSEQVIMDVVVGSMHLTVS